MNCIYDNPSNHCREYWRDGKLVCSYSYQLMLEHGFEGADVSPWEDGRMRGDPRALPEEVYKKW